MKINKKADTGFYIAGCCVLLLLAVGALTVKTAGFDVTNYTLPCTLHLMTGYYCPGCGGTRAVFALFRGEFVKSFTYQPFVIYTAVLGTWFMLSQTIERISAGKIKIGLHFREIYLWFALGIISINFLIKNLALIIWNVDLLAQ